MSNYTGFKSVAAGLGSSLRLAYNERYVNHVFRGPLVTTDEIGGAYAKGDDDVNVIVDGGMSFQVHLEQALAGVIPTQTNDGVKFVIDEADNEGFEVTLGRSIAADSTSENTNDRGAFVIGTDEAFFLRIKLDIGTVANSDQVFVGFTTGAYDAGGLINGYADMAGLNVDLGNIKSESRINAGSDVATDSTDNWTDADQKDLEIWVSNTGVVKLWVDGVSPTTEMAKFTFDNADRVHACLLVLTENANTSDPDVALMEWESGLLSSRGLVFSGDQYGTAQGEVAQSYVG